MHLIESPIIATLTPLGSERVAVADVAVDFAPLPPVAGLPLAPSTVVPLEIRHPRGRFLHQPSAVSVCVRVCVCVCVCVCKVYDVFLCRYVCPSNTTARWANECKK